MTRENEIKEEFVSSPVDTHFDAWLIKKLIEAEARIKELKEEIEAYKAVESLQDGNIPALSKKMFGNQKPKK